MTLQRVLTAAVMVPVVAGVVWFAPTSAVAAVLAVVIGLALVEFLRLGEPGIPREQVVWAVLCAIWLVYEQWAAAAQQSFSLAGGATLTGAAAGISVPLEMVLAVYALVAGTLALRAENLQYGLAALTRGAAGMLLVALPLSFLVRVHGAERAGPLLLLFTLVVIWVGDTAAYFLGRVIGRMPMAPVLSPKKTWEGAAANLLGSLLVAVVFARWAPVEGVELNDLLVMAALANLAGQAGDLAESLYKRAAGVKDSGALLPGHGGVLDRVDSLIFAAPVVWCYVWFVLGR